MARPVLQPVLVALALSFWPAATTGCNGAIIDFRADSGAGAGSEDGGGPAAAASAFKNAAASPSGAAVSPRVIDKVDVLFDIDNSMSMGDKQRYLKAAIPDLVNRLVNPNCIDASGVSSGASSNGTCASAAERPEFVPVRDMHLGIISSSLGSRGGDACISPAMAQAPFGNVPAHYDDQAHLLNRSLTFSPDGTSVTEGTVADAPAGDPYLYWFPPAPNMGKTAGPGFAITDTATLVNDFSDMTQGAGVFGCGIESPLESWYRFLVQPEPYQSITTTGNPKMGQWQGVDPTILQQRHDFLRPDSLVLIVVLSDENDSEIDVRSVSGLGVNWLAGSFQPPKGTAACLTTPGSTSCQSCAQGQNGQVDPNCMEEGAYTAINDWGFDMNLRHVHMMAKYGVDPQFPIGRYVTGLTSSTVPDRNGEYPTGASSYVGTQDCQNPLFAASLPDGNDTSVNTLCHPPPGPRTPDMVFYAHIGGVPNQLLHFKAGDAQASQLTDADWTKILGSNPESFDYSGIDPHMIESYAPRAGLPPPGSPVGADPVTGHEWITNTNLGVPGGASGHVLAVDLQYACTFPLVDTSGNPTPRDCTLPQNAPFCDCPHTSGSVSATELPPICESATQTLQTGAKAYPTIRELLLAKKLGAQGIVSSICPIDVADNASGDDPDFGYRPAVEAIGDRVRNALGEGCLPASLSPASSGAVACAMLLQIPGGAAGTSGSCLNPTCGASAASGLQVPPSAMLSSFCQSEENAFNQQVASNGGSTTGLVDPANVPVCELRQLTPASAPQDFAGGSCASGTDEGWCYQGAATVNAMCPALVFTHNALPSGATARLLCPP